MYTEGQMIEVGGRVWTSPDGEIYRVYLDWQDLIGLRLERHDNGQIRYAEIDDEKISNLQAVEIENIKVFWEDGQVRAQDPNGDWQGLRGETDNCRYVLEKVLAAIDAHVSGEQEFTEVAFEVTLAITGDGPIPTEEDLAVAITKGLDRTFPLAGTLIARL